MKIDPEPQLSFGRCDQGNSIVYHPTSERDVISVFATARKNGQRIAIRGGGHSFDGQALHCGDNDKQIVLRTDQFQPTARPDFTAPPIQFNLAANTVTLGCGVTWGAFFDAAFNQAAANGGILIPGSIQTGENATAGGSLAGDCLSRFSGAIGKESAWIDSFRLLTTNGGPAPMNVSAASNPDLFNAVIGGQGYIGFVTDITYKLITLDSASCAHTTIATYTNFHDLIQQQIQLVARYKGMPRAISSVWFTDLPSVLVSGIKGGVFNSSYANPHKPKLPGFPLYGDIHSDLRYHIELAARLPELNLVIHELLYGIAKIGGQFENDLKDFIFFMDGNAFAKETFEGLHPGELFPIVQQTFVIPTDKTEAFVENCQNKIDLLLLRPTDCDLLFVAQDNCFMSANYHLDGFAVSFAFEPIAPAGCPAATIPDLLADLSKDCLDAGGRIHMPKNLNVDPTVFRAMFSAPVPGAAPGNTQITRFEAIKVQYDPDKLLQNPFSDKFFQF